MHALLLVAFVLPAAAAAAVGVSDPLVVARVGVSSDPIVVARVGVARCRANCLHWGRGGDMQSCWSTCQLLGTVQGKYLIFFLPSIPSSVLKSRDDKLKIEKKLYNILLLANRFKCVLKVKAQGRIGKSFCLTLPGKRGKNLLLFVCCDSNPSWFA